MPLARNLNNLLKRALVDGPRDSFPLAKAAAIDAAAADFDGEAVGEPCAAAAPLGDREPNVRAHMRK